MAMVPRTQTLLEIAPIALSPAPIQTGDAHSIESRAIVILCTQNYRRY